MLHCRAIAILAVTFLAACGPDESKPAKPAMTEALAHESELLRISLTPAAERRLGLQTVVVGNSQIRSTIPAHGEIMVLVGNVPASVQTDLTALAASRVRADGEVARARAEVVSAQKIASRATELLKEEAGSVRASDDAQMTLAVARANLQAAIEQRALLGVTSAELGAKGRFSVRVAVFAGDVPRIDRSGAAEVRSLGSNAPGIAAMPVSAAPTANATAGSVDFYYVLPAGAGGFNVGQRVAVDLPSSGQTSGLSVPRSAILMDAYGGEWVYVQTAPHAYERRRIEVRSIGADRAMLSRGLKPGDKAVIAGAAELFGTEFGSK